MTERHYDNARDFLNSARAARFYMNRAAEEIRNAEALCEQITAQISGAPGGGGDVHKDGAWAALADHRRALEAQHCIMEQQKLEIERFINDISDWRQQIVLRSRYVDMLRWPKIRERLSDYKLYYSERQLFRIHREALAAAEKLWTELNKGDQQT